MIAGQYTLHLYCVNTLGNENRNVLISCNSKASLAGPTEADCKRQAVAKGWKFLRDIKDVKCPRCVKESV